MAAQRPLAKAQPCLKVAQGGEDLQLDIRQQDGLALLKNWQGEALICSFSIRLYPEASYAAALRAAGQSCLRLSGSRHQWSDAGRSGCP